MQNVMDILIACVPIIAAIILFVPARTRPLRAVGKALGCSPKGEELLEIGLYIFLVFATGFYIGVRMYQIT